MVALETVVTWNTRYGLVENISYNRKLMKRVYRIAKALGLNPTISNRAVNCRKSLDCRLFLYA